MITSFSKLGLHKSPEDHIAKISHAYAKYKKEFKTKTSFGIKGLIIAMLLGAVSILYNQL